MVCVKRFSSCENGIYIFTDASPSRFRLVCSHFTKVFGTWSPKSPTATELTRLPNRYTQPRGPYLRRLVSESNSSPRSRTYQGYIRLYAQYHCTCGYWRRKLQTKRDEKHSIDMEETDKQRRKALRNAEVSLKDSTITNTLEFPFAITAVT